MAIAQRKKIASGWKPSKESIKRRADKRRGQRHTEETKQRLSEISKNNNTNKKSIAMLDKNGILVRSFDSIADAARFLNVRVSDGSNSFIGSAARGKKKTAYGYKWECK